MAFAVSAWLCLSGCGDEEDTRETLNGTRTSPGGKYTAEDWTCCPGAPRGIIRLRSNGPDPKVTTLLDSEIHEAGVNPIFVWDDETHLTVRANFGQMPGVAEWTLAPAERLQGVPSALGARISYPSFNAADLGRALRVGPATSEYALAASDVTARVYEDRRNAQFENSMRVSEDWAFASCGIAFESTHAGPFEKIGLILWAEHNRDINAQIERRNVLLEKSRSPEKRWPEVAGLGFPFARFSIGKLPNGGYRRTALTSAFFEDVPPGGQCCSRVIGEEQSIAKTQDIEEEASMRREWPKRLAGDALRFRYVFDFNNESISYSMPLENVRDQVRRFVACVEDQ